MTEKIIDESQVVKDRFISLLGGYKKAPEITGELLDKRKENLIFLVFIGLMSVLIVVSGIYIILSNPYYSKIEGKFPEFLFTFGYHSIILAGILKTVKEDDSVLKHIFSACSVVLLFGMINLLFRIPFIGSKTFVWAILPVIAKFSLNDIVDPVYVILAFIVPFAVQFGLLAFLYRKEWQTIIVPYIAYAVASNTITLMLIMSPFVSGL